MAKGLRFLLNHVAETMPQVRMFGLLISFKIHAFFIIFDDRHDFYKNMFPIRFFYKNNFIRTRTSDFGLKNKISIVFRQ